MFDADDLRSFIVSVVRDSLDDSDDSQPVAGGTVLLGRGARMSSLALVGVLIQVEDYCREKGMPFSWTVDAAMSGRNSPFRTIDSLVAYLSGL
jgi:hypothetical protein